MLNAVNKTMAIEQKGLILVFRPESSEDFQEIAKRVHELDPSIFVVGCSGEIVLKDLPDNIEKIPLLVVYLVNPPQEPALHLAPMLAVRLVDKVEEYELFKKYNLPCLPIGRFTWGMELDPTVYGDWIVIKPQHMQSTGKDINMLPTNLIQSLKPSDFPEGHLIHQDEYFIQKFIRSGDSPSHYRTLVFLDEVIWSGFVKLQIPYPIPDASLHDLLSKSVASNQSEFNKRHMVKDAEVNQLALNAARCFPSGPIFGIDIIRDSDTSKLYVLELNAGGNVWHFSSEVGEHVRRAYGGRDLMIAQYNAWDKAAEALVRKTHNLARLVPKPSSSSYDDTYKYPKYY